MPSFLDQLRKFLRHSWRPCLMSITSPINILHNLWPWQLLLVSLRTLLETRMWVWKTHLSLREVVAFGPWGPSKIAANGPSLKQAVFVDHIKVGRVVLCQDTFFQVTKTPKLGCLAQASILLGVRLVGLADGELTWITMAGDPKVCTAKGRTAAGTRSWDISGLFPAASRNSPTTLV